jgi:hypothetical protein
MDEILTSLGAWQFTNKDDQTSHPFFADQTH